MRVTVNHTVRLFCLALLAAATLHAESGAHLTATSANVSGAGEAIKINVTEWSPDSRRDEFVAAWTLTATAPQARGGRGGGGGGGGRGGAAAAAGRGGAGRGGRGGDAAAPAAAPAADVAPNLPADPDLVDPDNPAPARGRGGARGGGGAATQTPEASLTAAIKKAPTVGILWTSANVGYSIKYAYRLAQPDGGERIILATERRIGMWSDLWKPVASTTPSDYTFSIIEIHLDSKGTGEARGIVSGKVVVDPAAKTIALDQYTTLPVILKNVKRQASN